MQEILDQLTANSSLTYRISGKYIFIDKKEDATVAATIKEIATALQQ